MGWDRTGIGKRMGYKSSSKISGSVLKMGEIG